MSEGTFSHVLAQLIFTKGGRESFLDFLLYLQLYYLLKMKVKFQMNFLLFEKISKITP